MATTPNLGLPLIDGAMTADVPRDMNALANAVDSAVGNVSIPDASLTVKGKTQLSSATNSTLEDRAATPKAVNDARVAADTAAKAYVDGKAWQKYKLTTDNGYAVDISGQDALSVRPTGFYLGNNMINSPDGSNSYFFYDVIRSGTTSATINAYPLGQSLTVFALYQARHNQGNWGSWSSNLFQAETNAKAYVDQEHLWGAL